MQRQLFKASPTPEIPAHHKPPFRQGQVLQVEFTGVAPSRSKARTLFGAPLDQAMRTILDDLGREADQVALAQADPRREPPHLQQAILVMSAGAGEGRWPLAYITWEVRALSLADAQQALRAA